MSINNSNINKFFNKLYFSFPNIMNIDKSEEFENAKYIYKTKDSSKWFTKQEKDNHEIFLFGKIKDNAPQPPLLTLTFDKISVYSKDCSGIINAKNVYINVEYFIENYPNFKTVLSETTIDVFTNGHANSINVIKLGDYVDHIDNLIDNINTLLNELDKFKPIEEPKPDITTKNNNKTCEICGKKLKKDKDKLCKKCTKKRRASNMLVNLLKYVEPQTPFEKADLNTVYQKEIEIDDCIWSLEEFNLLTQNGNEYSLVNTEKLTEFVERYGIIDETPIENEEKKEEPKKLNKKCSICKKTFPTSKFYKSKKTNDGLEDYCKSCKKYVNAANYLKEILQQVSPGSKFKVTDLKNNFKNPLEFNGRLWELQSFDLLVYDSDKELYILADLETCQNFLDSYYIKGSITIEPEIKKETDVEELTVEEQMDIVIECIKNGKTEKEAAEIADINLYKITHWYNEGKNNSGEENINFYNRYIDAKKEAKINSYKNFYVIESFNFKQDLTIADTLRKQQMEKILTEIGSGSSLKTAAFNSGIAYETLQNWYKRGKQNLGEEYNEFYEKINILQGPTDIPKPKKETKNETNIIENKYKNTIYEHILDPIPSNLKDSFKSAPKSKTGFAWVFKGPYNWQYNKTIENKPVAIQRKNLYDLYLEVKKRNLPWGVRDLNKAKQSLKECEPNYWTEINDDYHEPEETNSLNELNEYEHILDPLPRKYRKRFKKPSTSGFAWVKREKNSWRYHNKILGKTVQNLNLYELYIDIKEKNLPWGVRDLEKAKESLAQCEKPRIQTENVFINSEVEEDYSFEHILDPIPRKYLKRFRKPSSSGLAWVNNINNTWGYTNPKDNIRIYDGNIYNLYLKVKKQNLPWGVRDLEKAKESLAQCEKPNIQPKTQNKNQMSNLENTEVNCICFEENNNVKIIINGLIENDKFLNTLYKFKSYENNIKKIISDRHTQYTELFIELELEKNRLSTFKDRISMYGWKIIN